jgi:hypothetical protein
MRTRYGADAQGYWELTKLGAGSLRGEVYLGENANADSVSAWVQAPTSANPVRLLRPGASPGNLDTDFLGWYAMAVQSLGERFQFAVRYEEYDPNVDMARDRFRRWNAAAHWFPEGHTRVTVAYEIPRTKVSAGGGTFVDPKDNAWTVQFQHRF